MNNVNNLFLNICQLQVFCKDIRFDPVRYLQIFKKHFEDWPNKTLYMLFVKGLCTRADELIRARRVELNIAATIEKMELCLPLLTTYSKLKTQVEAKR